MRRTALTLIALVSGLSGHAIADTSPATAPAAHRFSIGDEHFLLDGRPLQIRCGEIHLARVPREYWRDRLRRCHAMGLNTVCAYLFWNFHEPEEGKFNWQGPADAAEFCRIAQEEGLWVLLRPGPYTCAEWEMGGLPWWLLKDEGIKLRTRDERFMAASRHWLAEVGRVLGPLQVTRGGPILMVQVENEYGSYGKDAAYMADLRQALPDSGFDVPLFASNPPSALRNGLLPELFQTVNFGKAPAAGFKALRDIQPTGPLMCGEFYPGWFDTWGSPHHIGDARDYLRDLDYMLSHDASFSIYMAHGGTTFGLWSGADRPFKPDTSSYDYDAPIGEAGWTGEKFRQTREVMAKHLQPGETLPDVPADNPVASVPTFELTEVAPVLDNLPPPIADRAPRNMEAYGQGHGCILYRTTLPAGPATTLDVGGAGVHDFAWVLLDGKQVGVMDRRSGRYRVPLPARAKDARLDVLVEAMGRVNFGVEVHDRKGIVGPVRLSRDDVKLPAEWQVYSLPLNDRMLGSLKWQPIAANTAKGLRFWRGGFSLATPADTFLDLRTWGKGVVWVNGHCLGRFWNIGPTQTAYVPGPWLRPGRNEVVILDLTGPERPVVAGVERPILNQLRPELDFARSAARYGELSLAGTKPTYEGAFQPGPAAQQVTFAQPAGGRQVCVEMLNAHDGKPFAAMAELDVLDPNGNAIPHVGWRIAYADSEELSGEDGSASNAIDGQTANFWHTQWSGGPKKPGYPHYLVIDLGREARVGGIRYTPRAADDKPGRVKDYRVYVGTGLVRPPQDK